MAFHFSDDQLLNDEGGETQPSDPVSPQPAKHSESIIPKASAPVFPDDHVVKEQLTILRTGDRDARQNATRQLHDYAKKHRDNYPSHIIPSLVEGLSDSAWMVRWVVTEVLVTLNTRQAKPHLLPLLADPHPPLRMTVVHAIALLGDGSDVVHLTPLLTEKQTSMREAVIQALGTLGSPLAIHALLPYLRDSERSIRLYTIEALGRIGDKSVVDVLHTYLKIGDEAVRWVCIEALGKLADPRSVQDLRLCLDDIRHPMWDDKRVCDMAVDALIAIGTVEAIQLVEEWRNKQIQSP
ncbi:MAG: HEAT repeat domain-containing protein [Anaerolineae bacterium]|nr:HEAT repeat domain-containing protein [Anaerolineae bacterium]